MRTTAKPGACPVPTTEIKCYELSPGGNTNFEVVVTAEDGETRQSQNFVVALQVVTCDPSGARPGVTGATVDCTGVTAVGEACKITPDASYNCDAARVTCKAQATTAVYQSEGTCKKSCDGKQVSFTGGEADCSSALKTDQTCTVKALSGKSCASVTVKCSAEGKYDVTGQCTPPCTGTYTQAFEGANVDCSAANDPGETCTLVPLTGWDCTGVSVTCKANGQSVSYEKSTTKCSRITTTTAPAVCTKYDDFSSASGGTFGVQMTCDDILRQQNAKYTTCSEVQVMLSAGKDCRGCECGCNQVAPTVTGATVNCAGATKIGASCQVEPQSPYTCNGVTVRCAASSTGFFYETQGTCIRPTPGQCQCTYMGKAYTCDRALFMKNAMLPKTCETLHNFQNMCQCNRGIQGCTCGCSSLRTPTFVGGTADCSKATDLGVDCDITSSPDYSCDKKITCDGNDNQGYFFKESGGCRSTVTTTTASTTTTTKESVQVHVNFDLDYKKYKEGGGEKDWETYVKESIAAKLGISPEDVKLVSTYENSGRRRLGSRRQLGTAFVIEIEVMARASCFSF